MSLRALLSTSALVGAIACLAGVERGSAATAGAAERSQSNKVRVNESQAAAAGIRKVSSKHLTLYTDLPSSPEIDGLPKVFDLAFPQWCAYFQLDPARHDDWHATGFIMKEKSRFERTGLLPADLPQFAHGYCRGYDLWVYDQPSDYYRRHLLLHEGTHSFMLTLLGSCGPPWYMEGMAELLATHRWQEGRLVLNYFPASRDEVPMWGRIKFLKDGFAARRAKTLTAIMEYGPRAHLETEPYGWCWAAAVLMDGHPAYQKRFREMIRFVRDPDFNRRFLELMGDDWDNLNEEWQVFVAEVEYGYDVAAMATEFAPGRPLSDRGATVTVSAQHGWQDSRVRLEAGTTYQLRAQGRYQVAKEPAVWWSEPGGVSIRYYKGRPLGMLLAAVRPDPGSASGSSSLIRPTAIGLAATLTPKESGTLYLRINHSAGELRSCSGSLTVEVRRSQE
jgi:hypothetical protein